jgi:hypothetical protein
MILPPFEADDTPCPMIGAQEEEQEEAQERGVIGRGGICEKSNSQ